MSTEDIQRALEQARAQVDSVVELVARLEGEDADDAEAARQEIDEDPLSIEIRADGWQQVGTKLAPDTFRVVLCTGGPHVELQGDLDDDLEPCSVKVLAQDWFTGFHELEVTEDEREALLTYCRCFYFNWR